MPRDAKYAMTQVQPCPTRICAYIHDYSPPECLNVSHRRMPSSTNTLPQFTLYGMLATCSFPGCLFCRTSASVSYVSATHLRLYFWRAMHFDCIRSYYNFLVRFFEHGLLYFMIFELINCDWMQNI